MIIHPQLQNFANNIAQQQTALSDVRDTMYSWKNSGIGKIQRQFILKAGESSSVQNCIKKLQPLFDDFSWLFDMIEKLCAVQSSNYFSNIELRSNKNANYSTIILHQERKFSIHLCMVRSKKLEHSNDYNNFIFGPDMMMLAPIGDAQINTAQLDTNKKLSNHGMSLCHNGALQIFSNLHQSINFIPQGKDIIFLRAIIRTDAFNNSSTEICHHYLQYIGNNEVQKQLANNKLSRAQLIFSILRHQQYKKAIPLFVEWVRNDVPDMRWYVMREFLALNIEAALPHLIFMADYDDCRNIRKIALETLQILKVQYADILNLQQR